MMKIIKKWWFWLIIVIIVFIIFNKINAQLKYKDYEDEIRPFLLEYGNLQEKILEKKARSTVENLRPFLSIDEEKEVLKKTGCINVEVKENRYWGPGVDDEGAKKCQSGNDFGNRHDFLLLCKDKEFWIDVQDQCGDVKQVTVWKWRKKEDFDRRSGCYAFFKNFTFNLNAKTGNTEMDCFINHDSGWGRQ